MMSSSSSSSSGGDDYDGGHMSSVSPRFFKIIVEDTLRDKKLLLPKKFTRILREETGCDLPPRATLGLPNGTIWEMGVTADDNRGVWLKDGFVGFAEFCSLAHGYLLLFKHRGGFRFSVRVYDGTAVEIRYPSDSDDGSPPSRSRSSSGGDNINGAHDQYSFSDSSSYFDGTGDDDHDQEDTDFDYSDETSREEFEGGAGSWMHGRNKMNDETGSSSSRRRRGGGGQASCSRRRSATNTSMRVPPSFKVTMTETYISLRQAYIPRWFSERYMRESERVGVKVGEKVWEMKLSKLGGPERKRKNTRITGGWTQFARDNKVRIGDVCIFQLFDDVDWATTATTATHHHDEDRPLLHVTILRNPAHPAAHH